MNPETLIGITIFTIRVITWKEVNETIKFFAQTGTPVPREVQENFDNLGKILDEMVATAPKEIIIQA